MSHYLAFRAILDENINFFEKLSHKLYKKHEASQLEYVTTVNDIEEVIKKKINNFVENKKTAIFLSGGIDSAILASFLPEGTKAYTFNCIADNAISEVEQAKKYCEAYSLDHEVINICWSDFVQLTPELLKFNQVPFHSIEVQLLKAAKHAKSQGIKKLIIGETADGIFGGMDKLMAKEWEFTEFIDRYIFTNPQTVLFNAVDVTTVFDKYRLPNNKIDYIRFLDDIFGVESSSSYMHALELANIPYLDPYSYMKLTIPLDIKRIRNGEPKYLLRELFMKRYPGFDIPNKIPMPRPMGDWLRHYKTTRPEFIDNCCNNLTGDQKWQCWCLEQFLNMFDPIKK